MIRLLVCCGAGFSSSAMVNKLKKEIIDKGLQDKISAEFSPFMSVTKEIINTYDVVMCCPHLRNEVPKFIEKHNIKVPMYIFPTRMYASMRALDMLEDSEDIIAMFNPETSPNPFFFPGEEKWVGNMRDCSYRRKIKK